MSKLRPIAVATDTSATVHRPVDFDEVAQSVAPRLYRVAVRMCGRPEDAEDLVQDTLLQAFRKWDQFEGRASPATWLYTIAARLCRRQRRRKAGEPVRFEALPDLLPAPSDPVLAASAIGDNPLDAHLRHEAERTVAAALGRLPPHYRLPLVLFEIAELSIAEIAGVLGLKESTVKTRIHRGRLAIRRALLQRLPTRRAPAVDHERQLCLDLLQAKQEALDRRTEFAVSGQELCARCQSIFATLDLGGDICASLGGGKLPAALRILLAQHRRATSKPASSR